MRPEQTEPQTDHGDARDAVTGPVGSARLVEPSTVDAPTDAPNADLERLTPIDDPEPQIPETPTGVAIDD